MLQGFLNSSQHAAFLKSYFILKRHFFLYEVWIRDCSRILISFISWFCVCMWEREREVSFLVTFLRTKENFLVVHTARLLVGLTQKVTEHDLTLSHDRPRNSRSPGIRSHYWTRRCLISGSSQKTLSLLPGYDTLSYQQIPGIKQGQRVVSLCAQSYLVKVL